MLFQHPLVQQKQFRRFYLNWQESLQVFRFVFQRQIPSRALPPIQVANIFDQGQRFSCRFNVESGEGHQSRGDN